MAGAINNSGQLFAWGYTDYGTYGDNVNVQARSSPVQIPGSWTQAFIGYDFAIGLKTDGTVWTWGSGGSGQLGDNTTISRSSPVQIMSGSSFTAIAARGAGYGGMAIRTDGTLWSWGAGIQGNVGDGTTVNRSTPVQITGSWTKIASGTGINFGIKTDGTLWAWGANSGYGMLGDGTTINRSAPVQIGSGTNWQYVSAANSNGAAAMTSTGLLYVWGRSDAGTNNSYRIGDGNSVARSSPVQVGSA
jgi:alpha-tubulin suppressor-like RCC1 family protein